MNSNGELLKETYDEAIKILQINSTPIGFSATTDKVSNYYSVWARDHCICAIAAVLSNDEELIKTSVKGVLTLLRKQIDHGQVPSYIEIENKKKVYGGFGQITSIDSNMWVAIAASLLYKKTKDKRLMTKNNLIRYTRLYRLLKAFDSNNCGLMEVPRAGDWADVFDRTYHVLYDECLYYQALKSLLYLFKKALKEYTLIKDVENIINKRIRWLKKRKPKIKRQINKYFWFTKDNIDYIFEKYMIIDEIEKKDYSYYQSHLMPFKIEWHRRFDSFGNILAITTGIADKKKSRKIINHVIENKINEPIPLKCLYPVVHKKDKDWEPIYRLKEKPYTYHNGGIWPMISGFWIYALQKNNRKRLAKKELIKLAKALKENKYKFNEYHHGKTGKAMGRTNQAWSAAGFIIGYQSVMHKRINIFDVK